MKDKALALILSVLVCLPAAGHAFQKTVITSAEQLPRRSYQLKGTAAEIVADRAQLLKLAAEIRDNLTADLGKLEIQDNATLAGYHSMLAILHAILGEPAKALAVVPVMRELETKPATRLTTGLFLEAWAKARLQVADESSAAFKETFEKILADAYVGLPYADIREHVETNKAQATMINEELVLGGLQAVQQVLDKTNGLVPEGTAFGILGTHFMLTHRLPLKEPMRRVYTRVSEANASPIKKNDIWASRDVALSPDRKLSPVVIGIWDSGVDMTALPEIHRFANPKETADGRDNDGNGFIDDVHGIGYELGRARSVGTLEDPTGKVRGDVTRLQRLTKGGIEMQAGIQSPEAAELQAVVSALKREEVKAFMEELTFYSGYMHGTHVAGIALAGNPAARILAARMTIDVKTPPPPYTMETATFNARMYRDTIEYFKQHGVKVVNMSWRYNSGRIEGTLAANGVGKDEAERREMARAMFEVERNALFDAIKGAPGILFVCGSGNENNDANFSAYIPASFELPNLVTVGAVDVEGKRTSFTTEGKGVDFYASGHEVESYVPGGARMKISGTSMASPQVANLAGKLLAVHPSLTPPQLIALMAQGADPSSEDPKIRLINPAKTLAMAEKVR